MPTNIQGLNIVQPQQASSDSQDLLSGQAFPDISAQLDLWTNLTFDTDEASLPRNDDDKLHRSHVEEDEDDAKSPNTPSDEKAIRDGHTNVVTATNLGTNVSTSSPQATVQPSLVPPFDINSFLSGFGIDPFTSLPQQPSPGAIAPSLAQLLALHSHAPSFQATLPGPFAHYLAQPAAYARPPQLLPALQAHSPLAPSPATAPVTPTATEEPPTKRSRARKASLSSPTSPEGLSPDAHITSTVAAEDKRRRNTAASARFRLKKKEREAALEGKAKELETKVNELERECEGLRRENGWLKGLVVGVTGAAQAPVVAAPPQSLSPSQLVSLANASTGAKRGREESELIGP